MLDLCHWLNCNFSIISVYFFDKLLTHFSKFDVDGFIKQYIGLEQKLNLKLNLNIPKINDRKTKNRPGNIVWFNPPLNKAVSVNAAKIFIQLINTHFPKSHSLHKIFNRNTVKVSYSCMQNISKIYKGHTSKITSTLCNQLTLCRVKEKSRQQMPNYVHSLWLPCHFTRATNLIWVGRRKWKKRYYNHKKSLNHKQ